MKMTNRNDITSFTAMVNQQGGLIAHLKIIQCTKCYIYV